MTPTIEELNKRLTLLENKGVQLDMSARDRKNLCSLVSDCNISGGVTAYNCYIGSGGTAFIRPLPTGWSTAKFGTGHYRLIHNLNSMQYVAVAYLMGSTGGQISFGYATNDIDIFVFNAGGSPQDFSFSISIITPTSN